jgi:hypothetical protein
MLYSGQQINTMGIPYVHGCDHITDCVNLRDDVIRDYRYDSATLVEDLDLEYQLAKVVEDRRPELIWVNLAATGSNVPAGAEAGAYREVTGGGRMAPIAPGSNTMPMVQPSGKKRTFSNQAFQIGFGWSHQEMLRAALSPSAQLNMRYPRLARRAYDETVEDMLLFGNQELGLEGIIRHQRVKKEALTTATSSTPITIDHSTAPSDILDALLAAYNKIPDATFDIEEARILGLPGPQYRHVSQVTVSDDNRTSIKAEFEAKTGCTIIKGVRLKDVAAKDAGMGGSGTQNIALFLSADPMVMELELPHQFQIFPLQQAGLNYVAPCYAEIAEPALYLPDALRVFHF